MPPLNGLHSLAAGAVDAQRGALLPWVPVCLGIGIAVYFGLAVEPDRTLWSGLAVLGLGLGGLVLWRGVLAHPVRLALLLMLAGFAMAGLRSARMDAPVLGFRYYGPVEGRIVAIDRSAGDRVRLTLDRVRLHDIRPGRTPLRVRVSLEPDLPGTMPLPGKRVALTAHLSPLGGAVEPGGFDFQRMAWFQGLGAVGYSRTPLMALEPPPARFGIAAWRDAISREVRARLPGEAGAFAAAVTTGDRSAMTRQSLDALRQSNLAHLLAISGLHMGLLTGFVFAVLRFGMVLVPAVALGWPVKKIAAVGALAAGAVYLALSGGNVATQRAFVMAAVVLVAVLLSRRALTLRAVAVAAVIVMALRPESVTEPGFQMSFAATIALVAAFRALRDLDLPRGPGWAQPVIATVLSSAVAGAATAPVAASHFNMIAHYGLLANLVSVPLMGLVVMPGAVLAACLAPFGLHGIGLAVMEPAIDWILSVARFTASQDGAVGRVVAPGPWVMPLFALGMLWLILWQGRARWLGIVPVVLGFGLWAQTERPPVLVSAGGGLVGVMTDRGRALNKAGGDSFAALSWLENDGDAPDQKAAAARRPWPDGETLLVFSVAGANFAHVSGRGANGRLAESCARAATVILAARRTEPVPPGCRVLDRLDMERAGGLAIYAGEGGPVLRPIRDAAGRRPWNTADLRRSRQ